MPRTIADPARRTPRSPAPRRLAAAAIAAALTAPATLVGAGGAWNGATAGSAQAARASVHTAAAPFTMTLELRSLQLRVTTPSTATPTVRVHYPDGRVAQPAVDAFRVGPMVWIQLPEPLGDDPDSDFTDPGQGLEVRFGDQIERLRLPEFTLRTDPAARTVSGRAPWAGPVAFELRDPTFERPSPRPAMVRAGADGRVTWRVPSDVAFEPGIVGTAWVSDPRGHRIGVEFAPTAAIISFHGATTMMDNLGAFAQGGSDPLEQSQVNLFVDPGRDLRVVALGDGIERWRTGPLRAAWGAQQVPGDDRPFEAPRFGDVDRLELWLDGALIAAAPPPRVAAAFDPAGGRVSGRAAPLRPLDVYVPSPRQRVRTTAGADGRFELTGLTPEDAGTAYYDYGRAKAISWLADGFGVEIPAAARNAFVLLHGSQVMANTGGTGELTARLTPGDGRAPITRRLRPPLFADAFVDFRDPAGRPVSIRPGDRIDFDQEDAEPQTLRVPALAARAEAAAGTVVVDAPADGALEVVRTRPDAYLLTPVDRLGLLYQPIEPLSFTRGHDGAAAIQCPDACAGSVLWATLRPPPLADAGRPRYRLAIVPKPWLGVAASVGIVRGFATAGAAVTATLLAADGAAVESRTTTAALGLWASLPPTWEIAWTDRFPDGIPPGTRLRVHVDGRIDTIRVPDVAIDVDVRADIVRGTGPAGGRVQVLGYPNLAIQAGREPITVDTTADAAGNWSAHLAGEFFTLRAGDAVLVNLLPDADQHFFQYDIGFVDGPPEPRETPTVAPTRSPAPTGTPPAPAPSAPPPSAEPTRGPWRAILPLVFDGR